MQETKLKLLERIVDRRQDSLYRFAYFRTGSQADAEDIVQDVLLRLFHSDCNLDRIDDVERYLWRAIANRCCDYHRHRRNATLPTERAAALADAPAIRNSAKNTNESPGCSQPSRKNRPK